MPEEFLSQEKFNELEKELQFLKTSRRKEVAESLEYARSLGDLSENAEYQEARATQAELEERIGKLETMLKTAKIVEGNRTGAIGMGSVVHLVKEGETEKRRYQLVGSEEADMMHGKVSYHSPLGAALMGKKKGDLFSFMTPKGKQHYKIAEVE